MPLTLFNTQKQGVGGKNMNWMWDILDYFKPDAAVKCNFIKEKEKFKHVIYKLIGRHMFNLLLLFECRYSNTFLFFCVLK